MKLVLGTVQFGLNYGINNSGGKPSPEVAFGILNRAYDLGIRELDTAEAYGNSTEVIADYLSQKPEHKFTIMSKFIGEGKTTFQESFEKSCKNLSINYLDGYYFHRFTDFVAFKEFDYVRSLKAQGKLGKLAVSLYSNEELEIAANSKEVDVIQLPFNIFDRSDIKIALLKKAQANNKLIYIRSAFLQGLFFKDLATLPSKLQPLKPALSQLHEFVKQNHLNMEDLCLKFVAGQSCVDKIIIGVDSIEQLEKNERSMKANISDDLLKEVLKIKIEYPELLNPVNWNN